MRTLLSRTLVSLAGVAAVGARDDAGLRAVLGVGAAVLVVTALLVRAAPTPTPSPRGVPTVSASVAAALERVIGGSSPSVERDRGRGGGASGEHARSEHGYGDEHGDEHEGELEHEQEQEHEHGHEGDHDREAATRASADPTGQAVRLEVGRDPAGRPLVVPAETGIAVVGSGALAEAVHEALVVRLAAQASTGDELRCVGAVPPLPRLRASDGTPVVVREAATLGHPVVPRAEPDVGARGDDGTDVEARDRDRGRGRDRDRDCDRDRARARARARDRDRDRDRGRARDHADGDADPDLHADPDAGDEPRPTVDVATLISPSGALRGAVVRSRDLDRPVAPGARIEIGRTGCRLRVDGGAQPLDPVLPLVAGGSD